jgi:multiple sugar transport system substrate-binding protein
MSKPKLALFIPMLLVAMSMLLTACFKSDNKSETPITPAIKSFTLKFSVWGNEDRVDMYKEMVAKFKEKHPYIEIEILFIPFNDYQQKLSIMVASKTAPDVGWIAERMIPQFMEANHLLDISVLKADPEYNFKDIVPSTTELFTDGDKLYGIPFSTPPTILFYNKTLFKAKGLKTPIELFNEGNWTFDELIKATKAIADPSKGIYGVKLGTDLKEWTGITMSLFRSYGAELFNPEGTRFMLNSPEGRQAMQLYSDLIFKYQVHPKPGDQTTFESGRLGMYQFPYSYVDTARRITDFEWDIAPLPAGPNGAKSTMGIAGYSIFEGTRHPKEALEFLKFISQTDNMKLTSGVFVPSRKSVLESDAFMNAHPKPSRESIQTAVTNQMKTAIVNPSHKNWQKIDTEMRILFDLLYTQSRPVDTILDMMEATINPLME